ncbi:MAG: hypothetical protein EBT50_06075 [Verrucomicrobia bacterium]|nr:hypothetical protein [Verrucomicrobiota bacterium]
MDGNGDVVVNPAWNPYYKTPSAINSGGSVYLTSSQAGTGRISIAVVPDFDDNAWNNPQPSGSVVDPVIQAGASVVMTADRIEIADDGSNNEPGLLYPALVAANTSSGRVVLQPFTANTDIILGGTKGADFNFTGTELGNIQANVLQVGNSTAGNISVEALIQLDTNRLPGAFSLIGNGTISDLGIGSLSGIQYGGGLRLSGNGAISFESLLNRFGTVAANSQGTFATPHDISLTSTGFFIGTADTVTGITASGSRVTLQPSSSVPINLGTKTLTTPGILYGGSGYTSAPTASFSTSGGTGAAATTTVGAGAVTGVTLDAAGSGYTSNPLVTLSGGGGSNASVYATSDFSFTDAMLDLITADTLQIGRNDAGLASGTITVSTAISPANISTLSLWTGAGVADIGGSTGIQVGSLAIRAGAGNVSLNGGGNNVSNLAAVVANGSFAFTDYPSASIPLPLNIAAVDGLSGIDTSTGNGAVTLTADDMNILEAISAGSGVITLQPLTLSTNISLNDPSNSLSLTEGELQLLNTSSTVVIGNPLGTGTISLGGSGNINLSGDPLYAYSLTLQGAASPLIFNGGLTLANNRTLTLGLGTGSVTSPFAGTDVTIGGGAGTLSILSAGSVGASLAPLTTSLSILSGAVVTPGGLYLSNAGTLSITGALNVAGDVDISTQSGDLTVSQAVNSANLSLTAAGNLSLAQAVNATGNATLTATAGSVNVASSLNSGGNVTLTAGGGTLTLGSTVGATGNITGTASGNITIQDAVTSGGIVSFSATQAATSITVGAGGSITSTLENGLTGTATIQLTADDLVLNGTLQSANLSGGILLQPFSDLAIEVFGAAATLPGAFFIGDATFGQLLGAAPVTIGRANGTAQVLVHGSAGAFPGGINRDLTIQSGAQPFSAGGATFLVDGALTTNNTDLTLDAGGGWFKATGAINVGTGTLTVFGQSLEFNAAVNGGMVSLRNKGTGNSYLAYAGPPAPGPQDQIVFGTGSITTNMFGYGADVGTLFVGTLNVGNFVFPGGFTVNTQGLDLYGGTAVQLEGNITSTGLPVTINGPGPLLLTGNRTITMGGGDLSILAGIGSSSGSQTLSISLGAGDLVLAGGNSANSFGGLTVTRAAGSTITMGNPSVPSSGLSLTVNGAATGMNIPGEVILTGSGTVALTGASGASLSLGSFVLGTGATAPLALTTTGGGTITSSGGIQAGSLTVNSASSATLSGAVNTTASGGISVSTPTLTTGSTMTAALGNISLSVNSMSLGGEATAQTGNVTLTPFTAGNNLNLGSLIPAASMLQLQAPNGSVTFQTTGAGQILLAGPINLSSSGTDDYNLVTAGGNVVFSGSSPVLTLPANGLLTLDLGNGNVISSGGIDYAASQGQLVILSAGNVTMGTDIPTFGRPGVVTAPASLTLRNAGSLSLVGPIDTGTGNVSIQTLSGNLTLASTIAGGTIQLGAAQNFINQAGSTPFTNRNGGRTFVYSFGQGYDSPYNFAGLQNFGVAFGRGFGSTIGSGNMLIYSAYAQVALDYGVVYNEMFAGNSVSALLAMDSTLFRSINGLGTPKAQPGGYIDYMLYPQRVEPAGSTLPQPVLSRLERELGRPPTVEELAADTIRTRQSRLMRTGAVLERTSFDERPEEEVENVPQEQAVWEGEEIYPVDGQIPQAQMPSEKPVPTAQSPKLPLKGTQADKKPGLPPHQTGPGLRRGPARAVVLRDQIPNADRSLRAENVMEEERMRAEFGTAKPVAGQIK